MKFTQHHFEGTPDEFSAVAHIFLQPSNGQDVSKQPLATINPTESSPAAVAALRAMLSRLPISDNQRELYQLLGKGQDTYYHVCELLGLSSQSMGGILRALARRVKATPEIHKAGLPGDSRAVVHQDRKNNTWYIQLTPPALEALKAEGIL